MAEESLDQTQLRQRQASLRKTIKDLRRALGLDRRLKRLEAISDDEWQRAEANERLAE